MTHPSPDDTGTSEAAVVLRQQTAVGILAYLLAHEHPAIARWELVQGEDGGIEIEGQLDHHGPVREAYVKLQQWATLLTASAIQCRPYAPDSGGAIEATGVYHGIRVRIWDGLLTQERVAEAQALIKQPPADRQVATNPEQRKGPQPHGLR